MAIETRKWRQFNPASPGTIGGTTPGPITGTVITATTQFVAPDGSAATPAYSFPDGKGFLSVTGRIYMSLGASTISYAWLSGGFQHTSSSYIGWSPTTTASSTADLRLFRDGAGILAQRNDTNAQQSRIYSTYTDASNYERLALKGTAGTKVTVAAETAGTGADNLDLELVPAGTGVVQFSNPQDGAAAATGTLTNAPTAGNPSEWLKVKIGANVRYIPCWT